MSFQSPFRTQVPGGVACQRRVVGEVAEERVALETFAFDGGADVDAVEGEIFVGLMAGDGKERRVEIDALDEFVSDGAGLGVSGPNDDAGLAGAALVEGCFAAAEGGVAGGGRAIEFGVHEARLG